MIQSLYHVLLDFVAPRTCELCGRGVDTTVLHEGDVLCQFCVDSAEPGPPPEELLNRLAQITPADDIAVSFIAARYTLRDDLPMHSVVYGLKYGGRRSIAKQCGRIMANTILDRADNIDIIIPVPLHPARLRERGFNQAELLAQSVANVFGKSCHSHIIKRTKNTLSQTSKRADERHSSMLNVFEIPQTHAEMIAHKHVLLIDDVWTTGSTINSCALSLLYAGAKRVSALTLCAA